MNETAALAGIFRDYGPHAGLAVLALALVWAMKRIAAGDAALQACNDARVADGKTYSAELVTLIRSQTEVMTRSIQLGEDRTEAARLVSASMMEVTSAVKQSTATGAVQAERMMDRLTGNSTLLERLEGLFRDRGRS